MDATPLDVRLFQQTQRIPRIQDFRTCGICFQLMKKRSIHRHVAAHAHPAKRRRSSVITLAMAIQWWGRLPRIRGPAPSVYPSPFEADGSSLSPRTAVSESSSTLPSSPSVHSSPQTLIPPSQTSVDSSPSNLPTPPSPHSTNVSKSTIQSVPHSADISSPSAGSSLAVTIPAMTAPVKDPHRLVVRGDRDLFELKVNPEFPARGRGVFSKFSFARGDFITEYTGCVITKQWAKGLEKKGGTSHFITIDQHHVIVGWTSNDIEDGYGIGSLFNDPRHSADRPNVALEKIEINAGVGKRLHPWSKQLGCRVTTRCVFRATSKGSPGDEFLFDYGNQYWDVHQQKAPIGVRLTRSAVGSIPIRSYAPPDDDVSAIDYNRRDFTVFQFLKSGGAVKQSETLVLGIHTQLSSHQEPDQYGIWARVDIKKFAFIVRLHSDYVYPTKPTHVPPEDDGYLFALSHKGPWHLASAKLRKNLLHNDKPGIAAAGCFINYASDRPGKCCNVLLRRHRTGLAFYARRDIFRGEELLGDMYKPAPPHLYDLYPC